MINVSFCLDHSALSEDERIEVVDGKSPQERKLILNRGGAHRTLKNNQSMTVLSCLDGLEALAELPYMVITSLEAVFGYSRQVEIDGVPQWSDEYTATPDPYMIEHDNWSDSGQVDEYDDIIWVNNPIEETITPEPYQTKDKIMEDIPADPGMETLYNDIYDQTPQLVSSSIFYTPSRIFAVPFGISTDHLNV